MIMFPLTNDLSPDDYYAFSPRRPYQPGKDLRTRRSATLKERDIPASGPAVASLRGQTVGRDDVERFRRLRNSRFYPSIRPRFVRVDDWW